MNTGNQLNDLIEQTITLANEIKELKEDSKILMDLHKKYNKKHSFLLLINELEGSLNLKKNKLRITKAFITFHYVSITREEEEEEVTSSYENELMPDNSHYEGDWTPYQSNNRY